MDVLLRDAALLAAFIGGALFVLAVPQRAETPSKTSSDGEPAAVPVIGAPRDWTR